MTDKEKKEKQEEETKQERPTIDFSKIPAKG